MSLKKAPSFLCFPSRRQITMAFRIAFERIVGLDFTFPDRMYDRGRRDGAMYYATHAGILKSLFDSLDESYDSIIDIGCGKGFVLYQAKKHGFSKVGGIEYDEKLTEICRRNMTHLNMGRSVKVTCTDARTFERYNDYNIFYLFNPFVEDVLESVISQIVDQCQGKNIIIIYYRPRYPKPIESRPYFTKESEFYDNLSGYTANIYKGKIPQNQS